MSRAHVVGEIFTIPLRDGRLGVGQIVGRYKRDAYYFVAFDVALPGNVPLPEIIAATSEPILFLALSLDAKLHVGHWKKVASGPVNPIVPLPAYKESVDEAEAMYIVDYSGERRRAAGVSERELYSYRTVVAPVRLEKALNAAFGLEDWHPAFDELRLGAHPASADAFP